MIREKGKKKQFKRK